MHSVIFSGNALNSLHLFCDLWACLVSIRLASFWKSKKARLLSFWLLVYFLDSTTTTSQNLDQNLDCFGDLLILGEAATARSSPKQALYIPWSSNALNGQYLFAFFCRVTSVWLNICIYLFFNLSLTKSYRYNVSTLILRFETFSKLSHKKNSCHYKRTIYCRKATHSIFWSSSVAN